MASSSGEVLEYDTVKMIDRLLYVEPAIIMWDEVTQGYYCVTRKKVPTIQLAKLLQNMKNIIKKKKDKSATVDKSIKLKKWEKHLLNLLRKEENPLFQKFLVVFQFSRHTCPIGYIQFKECDSVCSELHISDANQQHEKIRNSSRKVMS